MLQLDQTAHFNIQYDETLIGAGGQPNAILRAERVLGVCEAEFATPSDATRSSGGTTLHRKD